MEDTLEELAPKRAQLYKLKQLDKGQPLPRPSEPEVISKTKDFDLGNANNFVSGSDLGIVVTMRTTGPTLGSMFEHINRCATLYVNEDDDLDLSASGPSEESVAMDIDVTCPEQQQLECISSLSCPHEITAKKSSEASSKSLEKDRKRHDVRDKKAHRRLSARTRAAIVASTKGSHVLNCFGSWVPREFVLMDTYDNIV
ncbi:hypothetical protein BJV82DRAFT_665842 [Fennellomyces sp. T-0311]|nr:hypothetical protein BJV82DRAFT_665842 [Fennellomyces sp. T-0311]